MLRWQALTRGRTGEYWETEKEINFSDDTKHKYFEPQRLSSE